MTGQEKVGVLVGVILSSGFMKHCSISFAGLYSWASPGRTYKTHLFPQHQHWEPYCYCRMRSHFSPGLSKGTPRARGDGGCTPPQYCSFLLICLLLFLHPWVCSLLNQWNCCETIWKPLLHWKQGSAKDISEEFVLLFSQGKRHQVFSLKKWMS